MKKAYEVERISRCVVTGIVYAENAREARQLAGSMSGEDAAYEPRGVGRVRRAPHHDDDVPPRAVGADRHECERALRDAKRNGTVPSDGWAQDGETWVCGCGRVFVHICDEAQGCYWSDSGRKETE